MIARQKSFLTLVIVQPINIEPATTFINNALPAMRSLWYAGYKCFYANA